MQKDLLRKTLGSVFLVLAFGVLTYLYLYPGSQYLFEGREDVFLSDGTDNITQAHQYGLVNNEFWNHPSHFFYGSVYSPSYAAPEGFAIWVTWPERFFIVMMEPLVAIEQLPTAFSFFLMMATALSMFALGRALRWSLPLNFALSLAWAFSAYTRARAKVHIGFLGLYFLPLIFLGLWILHKGRGWRSVVGASILLLIAATTAQYYVLMLGLLAIFPAIFFLFIEHKERDLKSSIGRLIAASLPAAIFCLYCLVCSIPAEYKSTVTALPSTGQSEIWPHPFLEMFAAHPLDYFGGDNGIGPNDINPIRKELTDYNFVSNPTGNFHERTNGIRWSIWVLLVVLGVITFKRREEQSAATTNWLTLIFAGMGLGGFLLSLPPSYFGGYSPSVLLYSIISQFRVSSRAGIFVNFAVLVMIGLMYSRFEKKWTTKLKRWTWALPVLFLIDLPPIYQEMPAAAIPPKIERLQNLDFENCGYGLFFPYVSADVVMSDHYTNLSRMRGSGCGIFNAQENGTRETKMAGLFGPGENLIVALKAGNPNLANKLVEVAKCTNLRFIVFSQPTPPHWAQDICRRLDGTLDKQGLCLRKAQPFLGTLAIDACL